jgi:arginyl-tRNA synthetase
MDDRIRDDDLTDEDVERIAEQVGIGAVRYDVVSKQPSKAITFEWDRALDFEAQSAPYVQYVHARCCGILEEAGIDPTASDTAAAEGFDACLLETEAERDLVEVIGRFPAVIEEAAADLEPHVVATYTREFAETFNAFYRECPVLADDVDENLREARLALVAASKHAVGNALQVLGVAAPRSM